MVRMRPSAAMTVRRWRGERACRTVLQKEPDVDPCEDSEWCAAVVLFVYPRVEEAMAALRGPLDGRSATVRGTSGFESTAQSCRSASPIASRALIRASTSGQPASAEQICRRMHTGKSGVQACARAIIRPLLSPSVGAVAHVGLGTYAGWRPPCASLLLARGLEG